jgi:RNA polymerase sigma factor (sigma-70 family)
MGGSGGEKQVATRRRDACDIEPDDERLVADLRRHAPDSLARLHGRYAVGIYNLALRLVRQREDAEDITHDVLIRAYERLPRDREVRLRPWLYRITLNRCYDHLRATARRRPPGTAEREYETAARGDPFEQAELGALFERTLETLSARQQAAVLLKDVHGLSTAELAVLLGVTPGSAEVLLARARTSFRTRFAAFAGVEPRALPAWIGVGAALPLVALPPSLAAPPAPILPVHPLPDLSSLALGSGTATPAGVASGGLGSALGGSAALKLAAVLAAAATVATGVGDAHHGAHHRAPLHTTVATAATARPGGGASAPGATRHPAPSSHATASAVASPSPPAVAVLSTSPTPSTSPMPSPSSTDVRLGDAPPTPTPEPSPSASVSTSPTPSPSDSASPSPTPSPTPSPSVTDSPSPTASPDM